MGKTSPCFLKKFIFVLVAASVGLFFGCTLRTHSFAAASPRSETSLNESWQFAYDVTPTDAQLAGASVNWTRVDVPHTWNAQDGADGGDNYARGTGWYIRKFKTEAAWAGRKIFIQFDGANRIATVYLNGKRIGEHVGGFARFRFDLTSALNASGDNTLAVKVSNAPDGLAPISADFTFFGGIYRSVKLFSVDPIHVDVTDHASDGVYVTSRNVSAAHADLDLTVLVRNDASSAQKVLVRTSVKNAAGLTIASTENTLTASATASTKHLAHLAIANPRLWNGLKDPHLYSAEISLLVDGIVRDTITQRFGVRSFHVDPQQGFFLNGEYVDLRGVNRHQDRAGKGWAISATDEREDFALIKEMGSTTVRVAHYPQSQLWYDLADENGLVVWAEIPVVNEVPADAAYLENARLQLRELVRQNYNHPAIAFWGVGNETRLVSDVSGKPAAVNAQEPDRVIANLARLAKEEDPTRPSTYASHHRPEDTRNFHTNVLAFNKYIGWYGGKAEDFAKWIDDVHTRFPKTPVGMSEYGAGASISQHEIPPQKPAPGGPFHPEEYQSHFHEVHWQILHARPFVWGKFIWNMFDFAADARSEGDQPGMNDKGLVTYDRKTKKDAFYFYKASWSPEPTLHLTSKRYTARRAGPTELKAYSSAREVELFLNGKSLGVVTSDNHVFRWNAELPAGKHHVLVRAKTNGTALTDESTFTCSQSTTP